MSSSYDTISNTISIGTIIAIVVGSVFGFALLIGTIVTIVCIVKCLNRSKNVAMQGRILQPPQTYPYPNSWSNQYSPNTMSVANYPPNTVNAANYSPAYPPSAPPYTTSLQY